MSVRKCPASGLVERVPDTVDALVVDPVWTARVDQMRAALHRTMLPVYGGTVRAVLDADRLGGAR